jgi:hypothetical protein
MNHLRARRPAVEFPFEVQLEHQALSLLLRSVCGTNSREKLNHSPNKLLASQGGLRNPGKCDRGNPRLVYLSLYRHAPGDATEIMTCQLQHNLNIVFVKFQSCACVSVSVLK